MVTTGTALADADLRKIAGIDVDGTTLKIILTSGEVLSGADLVGATLSLSEEATVRKVFVENVLIDPLDRDRETVLYHLLAVDSSGNPAGELCQPDVRGERWGFPLRGRWDAEGQRISNDGFTLVCADGAQGKCVRFGYKPWKSINGVGLEPYYQACIRLVRADYCGGHGTTRDGMLIDVYDALGINKPDADPEANRLRFEAAWNSHGAVCVAHTRVPENATLDQLAMECSRLAGRLGDSVCTEVDSGRWGTEVLMFNRSR
jgi:hypothetical protein